LQIPDATFRQFVNIVDHFEGNKIRSVAISAASALDLFMDDSIATPRLQIEDVAEEVLELLPRTSPDMRALFATVSLSAQEEGLPVD
jgi:DNA-directed RNA polymerase subunit F